MKNFHIKKWKLPFTTLEAFSFFGHLLNSKNKKGWRIPISFNCPSNRILIIQAPRGLTASRQSTANRRRLESFLICSLTFGLFTGCRLLQFPSEVRFWSSAATPNGNLISSDIIRRFISASFSSSSWSAPGDRIYISSTASIDFIIDYIVEFVPQGSALTTDFVASNRWRSKSITLKSPNLCHYSFFSAAAFTDK